MQNLCSVCGLPRFSRTRLLRISRGNAAQRGISPWIAMLSDYPSGRPFCGASLISNKWIITAAHCLHHELDSENPVLDSSSLRNLLTFRVILGKHRTTKNDETEQTFQALKFIIHPEYNTNTFQHDIALVELSEKAFLNDYVMPVCLPEEQVQTGDMVVVSGWGKQFLARQPESLMEIEIPMVDPAICKAGYKTLNRILTDDMICAGEKEGGKDACSGDSGGPMVTLNKQKKHWYLAGTVSWGAGCGENDKYGVYSNVYKSLAWIRTNTGIQY